MFQSSPTPKGGRYVPLILDQCVNWRFNPRPPRKVGATCAQCGQSANRRVSILAHPERWALPPAGTTLRSTPDRFNPRPPRKVGATRQPDRDGGAGRVSILAHPERWALPRPGRPRHSETRFQSSPTPKGGRYIKPPLTTTYDKQFQSSPTPKGGRYIDRGRIPLEDIPVSILAHPERWALRVVRGMRMTRKKFQSSPTPKGGRYLCYRSFQVGLNEFQSSPTPKGGRYVCLFSWCRPPD